MVISVINGYVEWKTCVQKNVKNLMVPVVDLNTTVEYSIVGSDHASSEGSTA